MVTPTKTPPALILGAGTWTTDPAKADNQWEVIQAAKNLGIRTIDTSRLYGIGDSETFIGQEKLWDEFEIQTKASMALSPFGSSEEGITKGWEASSKALQTEKVRNYLLHVPDSSVPISSTLAGIQSLYSSGHFSSFGLSNFSPSQVTSLLSCCQENDYVKPTIYQSIYSLVQRTNSTTLFPLLRANNISIQAYSALASGFLVKTPEDIKAGKGLFDPRTVHGKIMQEMYGRPSYLAALEEYRQICEGEGESYAGVAYRWVVWHGGLDGEKGDAVVLGASSAKQLTETVREISRGELSEKMLEKLEELWKSLEADAPGDNFQTFGKLKEKGVF